MSEPQPSEYAIQGGSPPPDLASVDKPLLRAADLKPPPAEPKPAITAKEAGAELTARHAPDPIIRRTHEGEIKGFAGIRTVAEDLALSQRVERVQSLMDQGVPQATAVNAVLADAGALPSPDPERIEEIDPKKPRALDVREAARLLSQRHEDADKALQAEVDAERDRREALAEKVAAKEASKTEAAAQQPGQPADQTSEATDVTKAVLHPEVRQSLERTETGLNAMRQGIEAIVAKSLFPDVKSEDDLLRLAETDPQRFQHFHELARTAAQATHAANAAAEQRMVLQRAARERDAAEWDGVVAAELPEMKDPVKREAMMTAAREVLREAGLSDADLGALHRGEVMIDIRSPAAQRIIAMAARSRVAHGEAKRKLAAPKPPVLRPGTHASRPNADESDIAGLREQLKSARGNASVRIGAKILAAQRRARGD